MTYRRTGVLTAVVVTVAVALAACSDGIGGTGEAESAAAVEVAESASGSTDDDGLAEPAAPSLNDPTSPVPSGSPGSELSTPTSVGTSTTPVPVDGSLPEFDRLFPRSSQLPIALVVDDTVYDLATDPVTEVWSSPDMILTATSVPTIVNEGVMALVVDSQVPTADSTVSGPPAGTLVLDRIAATDEETTETPSPASRTELARGVSSFVVGPAGRTFAWTEPVGEDPTAATKLVMAALPYGRITSSYVFGGIDSGPVRTTGWARIVGIVGDNVLIRAGDPSTEAVALAIWVPELETMYRVTNYDPWTVGPTWANRVVLQQAGTGCGVVVEVTADGPAKPVDGAEARPSLPCNASSAATIAHSGAVVAGAGTTGDSPIDGDPVVVVGPAEVESAAESEQDGSGQGEDTDGELYRRFRVEGVPGAYWQPRTTRWLDDRNLVVLASSHNGQPLTAEDFIDDPDAVIDLRTAEQWRSHWGLYRCDLEAGGCRLAQDIGFRPTRSDRIMLVPLRIR